MTASSITRRTRNSFKRAARVLLATTAVRAFRRKTVTATRRVASRRGVKRNPTIWTEVKAIKTS